MSRRKAVNNVSGRLCRRDETHTQSCDQSDHRYQGNNAIHYSTIGWGARCHKIWASNIHVESLGFVVGPILDSFCRLKTFEDMGILQYRLWVELHVKMLLVVDETNQADF